MRPAHPCPICGHPNLAACERAAHDLPLALQERCLGCSCLCRQGRTFLGTSGPLPVRTEAADRPGGRF